MEKLIWTDPGLGQYYIYDWTLGQILTRCREESCQQSLTESSVKWKTRVYREGNLTMEEYTCGITQRGIRPYGHLAQYRADRSPGRANTSTGPSPSEELNWRRKKALASPDEGERGVTPASSSCPLLLHNTRVETGSMQRL